MFQQAVWSKWIQTEKVKSYPCCAGLYKSKLEKNLYSTFQEDVRLLLVDTFHHIVMVTVFNLPFRIVFFSQSALVLAAERLWCNNLSINQRACGMTRKIKRCGFHLSHGFLTTQKKNPHAHIVIVISWEIPFILLQSSYCLFPHVDFFQKRNGVGCENVFTQKWLLTNKWELTYYVKHEIVKDLNIFM